jgi:hypothetical protein
MPSSHTRCPSHHFRRCSMIFAWRKSSKEFRGCRPLPPPPTPSTSRRSLCRPLLQPVGRNARQDSSNTNNALNNNSRSSLARRIRTATAATAVAVVMAVSLAIAPPTPLLIRVCGPPTSTPGSTLFKCGRVSGGSTSSNPTYVRRLCWPAPFPTVLHRRSGRPSRHHSRICPFTVVSSRLQRLRLQRHGHHGQARGINSR